jgi:hypothetical protein
MRALLVAIGLCSLHAAALADAKPQGGSVEYIITGAGGGFAINVAPDFVTVVHLPEQPKQVLMADKTNFIVAREDTTVQLKPKANLAPGRTTNLAIDGSTFHLNIVLTVVADPKLAVSQVIFIREADKAIFEKRVSDEVARRVGPQEQDLAVRRKQLDTEIKEAAERHVAEAMHRQFTAKRLGGIARSSDNVIVRVDRVVELGDTVYVHFEIQNRDSDSYLLESVAVHQGSKQLPSRLSFATKGTAMGAVPAGKRLDGVVYFPSAEVNRGGTIEVRLVDIRKQALSVGGLSLE